MNRKPANSVSQKKNFTRTADKVHGKNMLVKPMRGGYRLQNMTCYSPSKGTLIDGLVKFGDYQDGSPIYLPCGKCTGCRTDLTKDWAVRCSHEAQMHTQNCVLTLTFNESNLDANKSLNKADIRNFLKRLRKKIKQKISYLYCGEYGDKFERPHYHVIIFGYNLPDRILLKKSDSGDEMYTSQILDSTWGVGHATIGTMSMASAFYVASYITKFVPTSERDSIYGERIPEFGHASKKPALGLNWLHKYNSDIFANDKVVIDNQNYRIPRYYLKKLQEGLNPKNPNQQVIERYNALKARRENSIDKSAPDQDDLCNKYEISLAKYKDTETLKSSDNHKRLEYLKTQKARRKTC